jgi:6-phosphogluconolactonase
MAEAMQQAQIVIARDMDELVQMAAMGILDAAQKSVAAHGSFSIALSGGSTPRLLYQRLAGTPVVEEMPWAHLQVFWGDERHVPPDHPDSNYRMAREALLDHVPLPPENVHRIPAEVPSAATAAAYADDLRRAFNLEAGEFPRFDLILLGMGEDGHTASLFPHTPALGERTALVTANPVPKLDTTRITLTLPVINNAARVWFLISGGTKAEVLKRVLEGPEDPQTLPSQAIAPHDGDLFFLLDSTAAVSLSPGLRASAAAGPA